MKTGEELIEAVKKLPPDHPFVIWHSELIAKCIADLNREKEQKEQS